MTVAAGPSPTVVPTDPLRRSLIDERSGQLPDSDVTGPRRRIDEATEDGDPEDMAKWFAYYLFALLVALLALGGLWISNFAL